MKSTLVPHDDCYSIDAHLFSLQKHKSNKLDIDRN